MNTSGNAENRKEKEKVKRNRLWKGKGRQRR
jgi:hypothetical protein